ncbi:MAG TPA: putative hydro-lyase [Gemmatimonadaceae bacterium]|nr:putative hydro-lyase [Gemmatimonadaceae bacterium]
MTGRDVRLAARAGTLAGPTAGLAPGFVQGNLVIVPAGVADDFASFCRLNPKPCPVIGVSEPGVPRVPVLGADIDLRTDLPCYRVWRDGELSEEIADVSHLWRDDLVGFVLGCSFTFEDALTAAGIPLRHLATGTNVAMYRTNIACEPAGPFAGPLVVSMRPFSNSDAQRAIEITTRFPLAHGAPVHLGDPEAIGISDLSSPAYGDPVEIAACEIPVFWACGVTPQAAIANARIPFAITHAPGCMLVTDQRVSGDCQLQ